MNNKTVLMVFIAIVALAAGLFVQRAVHTSEDVEGAVRPLDFSFPDASGQMQAISQWRGKVLVINFWATWCAPCLKEIPQFIKLQAEYGHRGVQFVGIAIEDRQAVADYLQQIKINYPVLVAGDAGIELARQLGNIINAVPFTVIVDQAGRMVHRQPGELSVDQLLDILMPLIAIN